MTDTRSESEFPRPARSPEDAALEARLDAHAQSLSTAPDRGFESRVLAGIENRRRPSAVIVHATPRWKRMAPMAIAAAVALVGVGVFVMVNPLAQPGAGRAGSAGVAVELASLQRELDDWFGGAVTPTNDGDAMETIRDTLETLRTLEAALAEPWPAAPDLSDLMEVL